VESYRNSATQRVGSIRKTLIETSRCLFELASQNSSVASLSVQETPAAGVSETHPITRAQTSTAARLKPMEVNEPLTGKTPKRNRALFYDRSDADLNSIHKYVQKRKQECPGMMVFCVPEDVAKDGNPWQAGMGRITCAYCGQNTYCYCLICHTPLCVGSICHLIGDRDEQPYVEATMYSMDGGEPSKLYFRNTCSDIWHHRGRENYCRPARLDGVTTNLDSIIEAE